MDWTNLLKIVEIVIFISSHYNIFYSQVVIWDEFFFFGTEKYRVWLSNVSWYVSLRLLLKIIVIIIFDHQKPSKSSFLHIPGINQRGVIRDEFLQKIFFLGWEVWGWGFQMPYRTYLYDSWLSFQARLSATKKYTKINHFFNMTNFQTLFQVTKRGQK